MPNVESGSWEEYQKLVLNELQRANDWQEHVDGQLVEIKVQIATLKVKAAVWGGAASLLLGPVAAAIAVQLLK